MKDFFLSMDANLQIYWYIAIIASIIFIVQTILTFIGADTDAGVDADFDGDLDGGDHPFQLFSLRNLVNFFLGVGWTGIALYNHIHSQVLLGIIALFVGLVFIAIFFLVARVMMRLAEDNSFNIEETIGKTADVYLTIPARKEGKGRVQISVKGSIHELDAMTPEQEAIKGGSLVKVIDVNSNVLIVQSI